MTHPPAKSPARDERRFFIGTDAVGKAPPPRRDRTRRAPAPPAPSAPPARPKTKPKAKPKATRRRWYRSWKVALVAVPALLVLLFVAGLVWANWKFSQIDRVEVSQVLATGGNGTNYLIVGSDTRAGIDPNDPNAGAFLDEGTAGNRSDTMLVLHVDGSHSTMLSVPRDLLVELPSGRQGRINGAYNDGPAALIETISTNLDIPIHRYLEVDFVTFAEVVDALGGITIEFPHPAFDDSTGLFVEQAGQVELDGDQALAYVRSRHYTEVIDGHNVTDPTADLGRVVRQQAFLRTVLGKVGNTRNPFKLMSVASSVADGLRIDDAMSLTDALRFAWRMRSLEPESVVLPTRGERTSAGAAVLVLLDDEATPVLDEFR